MAEHEESVNLSNDEQSGDENDLHGSDSEEPLSPVIPYVTELGTTPRSSTPITTPSDISNEVGNQEIVFQL